MSVTTEIIDSPKILIFGKTFNEVKGSFIDYVDKTCRVILDVAKEQDTIDFDDFTYVLEDADDNILVYGRIYSFNIDSVQRNVLLLTEYFSQNALNITLKNDVFLYEGEVVVLSGKLIDAKNLLVNNIWNDVRLKKLYKPLNFEKESLSICVLSGSFINKTDNKESIIKAATEINEMLKKSNVDVAIFLGPIIPDELQYLTEPECDCTASELTKVFLEEMSKELLNFKTYVIGSTDDACGFPFVPSSGMVNISSSENYSIGPNPLNMIISGLSIYATPYDSFINMSTRKLTSPDDIQQHVLKDILNNLSAFTCSDSSIQLEHIERLKVDPKLGVPNLILVKSKTVSVAYLEDYGTNFTCVASLKVGEHYIINVNSEKNITITSRSGKVFIPKHNEKILINS